MSAERTLVRPGFQMLSNQVAAYVQRCNGEATSAQTLEERDQESEYGQGGQRPEPDQRKSPEWLDLRRRHTNEPRLDKRLSLDR
jgi:hypothetical protein